MIRLSPTTVKNDVKGHKTLADRYATKVVAATAVPRMGVGCRMRRPIAVVGEVSGPGPFPSAPVSRREAAARTTVSVKVADRVVFFIHVA